jgi:hypothetical protein
MSKKREWEKDGVKKWAEISMLMTGTHDHL